MNSEEMKKHIDNVDSVMYEKGVWSDKLHSWNQIKMLLESPAEKWETVEEWEKRTGKVYPDCGPCFAKQYKNKFCNFELGYYCDLVTNATSNIYVPRIGHGKPPAEGKGEE